MMKILLPLLLCSQMVWAFNLTTEEDCRPVDYRGLSQLKHRNQKGIAWCFAHASADNLQFQERTKTQISAADIAINFSHSGISKVLNFFNHAFDGNKDPYAAEYGLAKTAINMIEKQGYCPEAIFPSEDWTRVDQENQKTQVEVAVAATEIYKLQADLQKRISRGENVRVSDLPFYYSFNNVNKKTFASLLVHSKKQHLLDDMRKTICNGHRVPFKTNLKPGMYFGKNTIIKKLNSALDDRRPASIDFSADVMENLDDDKFSLGLHTVAVVGRKFDRQTNQCYYLLKDSYGEACDDYDPRIRCEKGYIWMPEKNLIRSASSTVVLKG